MNTSLMRKLVNDLANHKSKQDIQGALEVYHPQAELVTTGFNTKAQGTLEIEQQLSVFFKVFPDYQVLLTQIACNDHALLATGDIYVTPTYITRHAKRLGNQSLLLLSSKKIEYLKKYFS